MTPAAAVQAPIIPDELVDATVSGLSDGQTLGSIRVNERVVSGLVTKSVSIESSIIQGTEISTCRFKQASLSDVIFDNCLLFGSNFDGSGFHRVSIKKGMLSGIVISDAVLKDVMFEDAKIDLANFRVSKLRRVHFKGCDLTEADFRGAELSLVIFEDCDLSRVEFANCTMDKVDLRSSDISTISGTAGLKGATIDMSQLISISQVMAAEIGLKVVE